MQGCEREGLLGVFLHGKPVRARWRDSNTKRTGKSLASLKIEEAIERPDRPFGRISQGDNGADEPKTKTENKTPFPSLI